MATSKKVAKRPKSAAAKASRAKGKSRSGKASAASAKRAEKIVKKKKVAKTKAKRKSSAKGAKKSVAKKKAKASPAAGRKASAKTKKATAKKKSPVRRMDATGRKARSIRNSKATSVRKTIERKRSGSEALEAGDYEPPKPVPKTRLNDKQLAEFKRTLLAKRRVLTGDVRNLTIDALNRDMSGDLSSMPIHMADIGSDNWEQEFTLGLIENEQQLVREIDEALQRIEDRTYGVCLATHKPITVARLRAKPWAKYLSLIHI